MKIISCIQFKPKFAECIADVRYNIRCAHPLLEQAMSFGSNIIVLPELCFTGYSFLGIDEAMQVSELRNGLTYRTMRTYAIQAKAYVCYGYIESDGLGSLFNSCAMISPDGNMIAHYRKINLFGNDFLWATQSTEAPPIVETELGKISIVICRDLRDKIPTNIPNVASENKNGMFDGKKVDIVAACTNWGKGGFPSNTWMDFSANNKCILAVSNRWGVEQGNKGFEQDFGHGGSVIIEPPWKVHIQGLLFDADCVVTAVVH